MSNHQENNTEKYIPETFVPHTESHGTKHIWKTFWILLALTIVDLAIYFMMPGGITRNWIFIGLGLVKAYYIMGIFMHLNNEDQAVRRSVVWPLVFLLYFIALMLIESNAINIATP